jgi:hypothetical protein
VPAGRLGTTPGPLVVVEVVDVPLPAVEVTVVIPEAVDELLVLLELFVEVDCRDDCGNPSPTPAYSADSDSLSIVEVVGNTSEAAISPVIVKFGCIAASTSLQGAAITADNLTDAAWSCDVTVPLSVSVTVCAVLHALKAPHSTMQTPNQRAGILATQEANISWIPLFLKPA